MPEIRALTLDELPLCLEHAQAFHEEMRLPGAMIPELFLRNWTLFLSAPLYQATILGLWTQDQLIGGLGALISPDLHDGRPCAHEMFLFISKEHRGGSGFLRLLQAFKQWSIDHQAVEARIVHMEHVETDEALDRIYRKIGYQPVERAYRLPLVGV